MIRVLIVLPFYGGSLPIGRYCAHALQEADCLVDTFESPSFFSAFQALKGVSVSQEKLDYLENSFLQVISNAICAKADTFQPDIVLCMAQAPLNRQALRRFKKDNIITAMWFVEDYSVFTYWRAYAPLYDVFAVIQKEPFFSELESAGVSNYLYLPLAAEPSIHKPLSLTADELEEYSAEVSFLGAGYPNRREAFKQLVAPGFKIWGTEWEEAPQLLPYVQRKGARITPDDAVKIYNASQVNLNLHSSIYADRLVSHGDFVNPRTFELAACNAFQLVDRRSLMSELFEEGDLAIFDSLRELKEKIAFFLAHKEERDRIAENGMKRVLQEHCYVHRMSTLLSFIKEKFPACAERQLPSAFETLGEEKKNELVSLCNELALPFNVSFNDLVTAVRIKKGVLSDLETAILFLDEWKKQYHKG